MSCCWKNQNQYGDKNNISDHKPTTIIKQPQLERMWISIPDVHAMQNNVNEVNLSPVKYGIEESGGLSTISSRSLDSATSYDSSNDSMNSTNLTAPYVIRSYSANVRQLNSTNV
ncbi:unnamed protein product [Rotaria magnacalcarata]|uniref:Uncharacterized protein n=1 Tax=Rotaria magnacalcarata TaxID=392030 RepID=A0A819RQS8_9BILA|nr:unnamed protein product [Rotaria magnacalcarata]CAF4046094.1 unnamed protein product [Rotaria magnacalcarata]